MLLMGILGTCIPFSAAAGEAFDRVTLNMNDDWGYYQGDLAGAQEIGFDDSEFAAVTIPHTMRLEKKHAGGAASVYQGIGWYRKYFTVDAAMQGKKVFLDFEGVMIDSDVYLNGEKVYTRNGGYVGFQVDISDKVVFGGENVLALRVSSKNNSDTPPGKPLASLDFHYYGGIYRNVKMVITDKAHITDALGADKVASGGVLVSYADVSAAQATVHVKTHIANEYADAKSIKLTSKILNKDGAAVAHQADTLSLATASDQQATQVMTVTNPQLWHPDRPYLYTLVSELSIDGTAIDSKSTHIGIRWLEMKPDGFYLNGQKLYVRGANRHQSYANVGDAAPDSMQVRDALLLKADGFNAVRATHYPQAPAFLDACDKLGILVVECQPGWQNFTNTQTFYDRTLRDVREMVRRDRNRPSVILWEASLNETGYSAAWAQAASAAAHQEMPGSQMFTAADYGLRGEYYDVNYKIIDGGVDKNPNKTVFTREWGDWAGRDQARRADGEAMLVTQVNTHQTFLNGNGYPDWGGLDAAERMAGYFLWSWNDYARGSQPDTLPSGTVEIDRVKKPLFYWLKSMTDARNPVYGPMVYIASNYTATSSKTINVYSNCDSVKLYQNGTLIKELTRAERASSAQNIVNKGGSPIYVFTLPSFVAGELRAEGVLDGQAAATHTVKTPGNVRKVLIEADTMGIAPVADGSDLIPVYFKVVDENGTVVPSFNGKIDIEVLGEGKLVGKDIPRIGVEEQTCEAGIGFAFIRTTKTAGEIAVTAKGDGMSYSVERFTTAPYTGTYAAPYAHTAWTQGVEKFESGEIYKNLAKGKTASASSTQSGRDAAYAFDENTGTRWCADGGAYPQWLQVDLGKSTDILGFAMHWENASGVYTYTIQTSENGNNWTTVVDQSGNTTVNGSETQMAACTGRYVRLNILSFAGGWASLWEFGVLGKLIEEEVLPGSIVTDEQIRVITSSCETESDRGVDKLRDGDTLIGTGWLAATDEFPQSVTVRFEKPLKLTGSRIYWEKDSSWYTYDLEVSQDGKTWVKALDSLFVGGQHFKPETFHQVQENVRFARVILKDIVSGSGQARIGMAELIFYEDNAPVSSFDYLSDLAWVSATSDYTSVVKDKPVYASAPIKLNSAQGVQSFTKGLSSDTNSEIVYDLSGKNCLKFESYLGIATSAGKQGGEAIFTVYADDRLIYTSPVKMRNDNCEYISLDIEGVNTLKLAAKWSGNTQNPEARYNTHVVWAGAKVLYKNAETKPLVLDVTVTPGQTELYPGESKAFAAEVDTDEDASQAVTWTVEGAASADTTISEEGQLAVGLDETARTLTVRATAEEDGEAAGTATVTVKKLSVHTGATGETVSIPITLENCENFAGGSGFIQYDDSLLTLQSITAKKGFTLVFEDNQFVCVTPGGAGLDGSVVVGYAVFSIKAELPDDVTAYISFTDLIAFNMQPELTEVSAPAVRLDILGVPPMTGDVSLDGKVDLADAILLMQYLSGNTALSARQRKAADVNRDGKVNVGDVTIIMQMCL